MDSDTSTIQHPMLRRKFIALKTILVTVSMVGLIASNVASVVSASAHDWMHSAMRRMLSIGGQFVADRVMANSPKAKIEDTVKKQTADLDARNKQLEIKQGIQAKELESAQIKSKKLAQQLEVNGKQAKATVSAVHQRLQRGVTRNVAALPGESIPYLGLSVTLAVTTLDIYDACQTMKDFNALLRMMGQGEENPDLCGQKVPTVDQVLSNAKSEWRSSVQRIADETKSIRVASPEVRLPTREEVIKGSCTVTSIPYLCP